MQLAWKNSTDASIASICFSIGESPSTIIAVFDIVQKGGGRGGGSSQMITVLHRGGPANDYGIT